MRAQDNLLSSLVHQLQAILSPGAVALSLDTEVAFAVGEEEVVEDNFVKKLSGQLDNLLRLSPLYGILVAVGLEVVHLADSVGDTTCNLNTLVLEELDDFLHLGLVDDKLVAVSLEIDLVNLYLI